MSTYKSELIRKIIKIDPRETEKHLRRLPVTILEGQLTQLRRWNKEEKR